MSPTEEKKRNRGKSARKIILCVLCLGVVGIILYWFPPFRIVPLDVAKQKKQNEAFDPESFARDFWNKRLMKSLGRAVEAATLFAAIGENPRAARDQYGRTFGIGNVYYYFVTGVGHVVSVEPDAVGISLDDEDADVDIYISTSNIFGNAIRNGTGLIDINKFPNSQDFNNVSIEINRIVETEVLSEFRDALAVGSRVQFTGCAEIMDEDRDLRPMRIIPIVARIE